MILSKIKFLTFPSNLQSSKRYSVLTHVEPRPSVTKVSIHPPPAPARILKLAFTIFSIISF